MIDPVWELVRRSLVAGLRNGDLKEPCSAEYCIGTVAWSRALYQSAEQRLKDRIVFAVVQARQWTPQRFHDDKLCMSISNQFLPMRRGQCVVRIEEKAMFSSVYIGNLEMSWTRFANSKAHVRVEIHVEQKRTAMEPIIMSACCCFKTCDIQILLQSDDIGAIIQGL